MIVPTFSKMKLVGGNPNFFAPFADMEEFEENLKNVNLLTQLIKEENMRIYNE